MHEPDVTISTAESTNPRDRLLSQTILVAYLMHLAVPLVAVLDWLWVAAQGTANKSVRIIGYVGAIWIAVALAALLLTRDRSRFLLRMSKPLLIFFGICIALLVGEVAVRAKATYFNRAVLKFPPGEYKFDYSRWQVHGVSPRVTFTVNAMGLRGPMPPQGGQVYKIITVGGSTTESMSQSDDQEWPHLLMTRLNQRQNAFPVWVGNAGVSGLTTVDHATCLRRMPVLRQADLLIFLIGVNDLTAALLFNGSSTQRVLEDRAELFAEHAPDGVSHIRGLLRRSWIVASLRNSAQHLSQMIFIQRPGSFSRGKGSVLPLPDIRIALEEYAQRVRALEQECRLYHRRCVFLTQPTMWRSGLSAAEESTLYGGAVGYQGTARGYGSSPELGRAMAAYNQTLLAVCHDDKLECYDLAAAIPKDTAAFSDESHYTDHGASLVADYLAERLGAVPPLDGSKEVQPEGGGGR